MDMDRENLKLEVVYQYYMRHASQAQIAKSYSVSRSYVSKLLIEARNEGLVEIKINKPLISESETERRLRELYGLKKVLIATNDGYEGLGEALNKYLNSILNDGDIIGVAWGKTLLESSRMLESYKLYKELRVVQLCGGVSSITNNTYANDIVINYADAFGAMPFVLPLPAFVESHEFKKTFLKESNISSVMSLMNSVNIAVFTVGVMDSSSSLIRTGYISQHEIEELLAKGAAGELCTHVVDKNGQCVDQSLEDRSTSISLGILKKCPNRIALALEVERIPSLRAALKAGYINVLIISKSVAEHLSNPPL